MYADDMALVSRNRAKLQECFNKLATWADRNKFQINNKKTVMMVFRKG
jgi:hypothetical protein